MKMGETVEVVRERERERATLYSNKKEEKSTLNKVDITERSYIIRRYNRHY